MLHSIYRIMNAGTLGQFMEVVPITCVVGILYAVWRVIWVKKKKLHIHWGVEIMRWLFVCYLTGLVNLILVPANLWMGIWANICVGYSHSEITFFSGEFNLIPTVFKWITGKLTIGRWVLKMLIYNFLMFVPFGFFLPFVSEKVNNRSIWKIAVIVPIVIEVIQPIVGRSFDVDDLLMNFAGIIIGYLLAIGVKALCGKVRKEWQ